MLERRHTSVNSQATTVDPTAGVSCERVTWHQWVLSTADQHEDLSCQRSPVTTRHFDLPAPGEVAVADGRLPAPPVSATDEHKSSSSSLVDLTSQTAINNDHAWRLSYCTEHMHHQHQATVVCLELLRVSDNDEYSLSCGSSCRSPSFISRS